MPRKFFKRHLPSPALISRQRSLGMFGSRLSSPELWHLNRTSVSTAFGVGLFLAFLPVPGQMILAALAALWLRCNLPLSVMLVWISNPLTVGPLFFSAYKVGTWVLGVPEEVTRFSLSWEWLVARADQIWLPLTTGALICGALAAALGFVTIQLIWRWHVVQRWERRRTLRRLRAGRAESD